MRLTVLVLRLAGLGALLALAVVNRTPETAALCVGGVVTVVLGRAAGRRRPPDDPDAG